MYANFKIAPPPADLAEDEPDALAELLNGGSLDEASAGRLFTALVEGRLSEAEISAMLVALRLKGETVEELVGAARALRRADLPFVRPDYLFADTCGTGGDSSGSINISTAVAFVAAAAGLPIAKHGNRSITSRCGSADVLEHLGARLDIDAEASRRILDDVGFCFLFAPLYHPGLRHAGPVRRALGVRTIMNILGPCVNPAEPPVQLLGVADPKLLEPVARTLASLGIRHGLVVHGGGMDEIALHAETRAIAVRDGTLEETIVTPEQVGVARASREALAGGGPAENGARLRALLAGHGRPVEAQAVALNTAALLLTAGLASDLREGFTHAMDVIASGSAYARLASFVEATRA
jgi:anthranilate phosphoribosyltransferase